MLPIKNRVKTESFEEIMKDGVLVSGDVFYLKFLNKKNSQISQFGFIVPKKIKKTSPGRHLIKRRMTAVVEKVFSDIKPGLQCLVFCQKDISPLSFMETESKILKLFKKASIL